MPIILPAQLGDDVMRKRLIILQLTKLLVKRVITN